MGFFAGSGEYPAAGLYSLEHILILIFCFIVLIFTILMTRKKVKNPIRVIKIVSIVVLSFEIVKVSDLIYKDNYRLDHTGKQHKMRQLLFAAVLSSFTACGFAAAPAAEYAPPDDYGLTSSRWKLTPDAEKLLAEWSKIPYVRKAGRTDFFVRAQLKYGINRSDFLHHWYDRPLLQDSSLGYVNQDVEKLRV